MKHILLTLFICLLSIPVNAKESVFEKVVSSGELNCAYAIWPPFFSKDALTGELSGFNYDIIEAVGRELGLKINFAKI